MAQPTGYPGKKSTTIGGGVSKDSAIGIAEAAAGTSMTDHLSTHDPHPEYLLESELTFATFYLWGA